MAEWQTLEIAHVRPTPSDVSLALSLQAQNEAMLQVDWLQGDRARLATRSWVGVVRFESFEIRVEPKFVGGNLGILQMLDFTRGLDSIRRLSSTQSLETTGVSLLDLVCWLLADQSEYVLRHGLLSDYVAHEETLGAIRGRFQIDKQIRLHYGRLDALECRYDEYENDILENRILAVALRKARSVCRNVRVQAMLKHVEPLFSEVCPSDDLDIDTCRRQLTYHRRNGHYAAGHRWAFLLLGGGGVSDVYTAGQADAFAFMLDMNRLFEEFVEKLLLEGLEPSEWSVSPQSRTHDIIVDAEGKSYSQVIPDLLLRSGSVGDERVVPVDSKYKLYADQKVAPGDIYQAFLYAYAFAPPGRPQTACIIFPADQNGRGFSLTVQNTTRSLGCRIQGFGLDVPTVLSRIEKGQPAGNAARELIAGLLEVIGTRDPLKPNAPLQPRGTNSHAPVTVGINT